MKIFNFATLITVNQIKDKMCKVQNVKAQSKSKSFLLKVYTSGTSSFCQQLPV